MSHFILLILSFPRSLFFSSFYHHHHYLQGAVLCTAEYDVSTTETTGGADGLRAEDLALIPAPKPTLRSATQTRDGKVSVCNVCLYVSACMRV